MIACMYLHSAHLPDAGVHIATGPISKALSQHHLRWLYGSQAGCVVWGLAAGWVAAQAEPGQQRGVCKLWRHLHTSRQSVVSGNASAQE